MDEPAFSDKEVADLLAAEKWVELDAWDEATAGRDGTGHVVKGRVEAIPCEDVEFEFGRKETGCAITLKIRLPKRGMAAVCRYDIQDKPHRNPDGRYIQPGTPHRHVYCSRVEDEEGKWDALAEEVDGPDDDCETLLRTFAHQLNVRFMDRHTQAMARQVMQ